MADVPAIDHTMQIAHWWPSVIIHCKCQPGEPTLILLLQFGVSTQCPHCMKKATAVGVNMVDGKPLIDVLVTFESAISLH